VFEVAIREILSESENVRGWETAVENVKIGMRAMQSNPVLCPAASKSQMKVAESF
jgi:hypothetical protein